MNTSSNISTPRTEQPNQKNKFFENVIINSPEIQFSPIAKFSSRKRQNGRRGATEERKDEPTQDEVRKRGLPGRFGN